MADGVLKSALSTNCSIDVICGSLTAKLFPSKLQDGSSRCISFTVGNGSFMTPCEFERRAGRSSSKNWKRTIRYAGKPIGNFLQVVENQNGKKKVHFVSSSQPPLSTVADTAGNTLSPVSAFSLINHDPIITSPSSINGVLSPASPNGCTNNPASPDGCTNNPASPDKSISVLTSLGVSQTVSVSDPAIQNESVTNPASHSVSVTDPASHNESVTVPVSHTTASHFVSRTTASPGVSARTSSVNSSPASPIPVFSSPPTPDSAPVSSAADVSDPLSSPLVATPTGASSLDLSVDDCPLCKRHYSSCSHLWQHINSVHISRSTFPPVSFFDSCSHLICSKPSCRWASHSRFHNSGCRRLLSTGKHCGASLVQANTVSTIPISEHQMLPQSTPSTNTSIADDSPSTSSDPLDIGLNSVQCGSFQGPAAMDSEVLNFMMELIMVCPVSTVAHIPRSVRPLLAQVLSVEFRKARSSVWGFVRLSLFAKLVLRLPSARGSKRRRFVMSSVLLDRLHLWSQPDGICCLWASLQDDLRDRKPKGESCSSFRKSRALFWAREGRYSNALQALSSQGVAGFDDDSAYNELLNRHPSSPCPDTDVMSSDPALTVDESMVLSCLRAFPKGTSPGASKLRAQHLLDAIAGSTAPASRDCLLSLTSLMNYLISGKAPSCLAPWVCGAPLTALVKKGEVCVQLLLVR